MPPLPKKPSATPKKLVDYQARNRKSLWTGPGGPGPQGGITFSLLSRFLVCRERFRLHAVEGYRTDFGFNHRLEFGNLWHACEEGLSAGWKGDGNVQVLTECAQELLNKYPTQREQVEKWYNTCRIAFPHYVAYWAKHKDNAKRVPILQEVPFDVPYTLPSGRVVRLRGKWDAGDWLPAHTEDGVRYPAGIWVQENKTKGNPDRVSLVRQLKFDLQTMIYVVALRERLENATENDPLSLPLVLKGMTYKDGDGQIKSVPVIGVRYNVIRRPLSGGAGTIVRHKATQGSKCPKCKELGVVVDPKTSEVSRCPKCRGEKRIGAKPEETEASYWQRLSDVIADKLDDFFMRWKVRVTDRDVERFCRLSLDPILEQLCEWWEDISGAMKSARRTYYTPQNFLMPYGVFNPLLEGASTDFDEYLASGNTFGLKQTDDLFPELKGV